MRQLLILIFISSFVFKISNGFAQNNTAEDSLKAIVQNKKLKQAIEDSIKKNDRHNKLIGTVGTFQQVFGIKPIEEKKMPRVAFWRSMVPVAGWLGWGQYTNKQYWKMPVVAGAAGAGLFFLYYNHKEYLKYRGYLKDMYDSNLTEIYIVNKNGIKTGPFTYDAVNRHTKTLRNYYQLTYIGFGVGWLLVALESNVAAHMRSFDVSSDISLKVKPTVFPMAFGPGVGLKMDINFK